jgi:hypothetical protein
MLAKNHPRNNSSINLFNHDINLSISNTTTTANNYTEEGRSAYLPTQPQPAKKGEKYNFKKRT